MIWNKKYSEISAIGDSIGANCYVTAFESAFAYQKTREWDAFVFCCCCE